MDTPKPGKLPNQVKQAARLSRAAHLSELNRRWRTMTAQLGREYESQHGVKLARLYRGQMFAQPAFEGSGKLPEILLGLLLDGKGVDPKMRKAERHALLIPLALAAIGASDEEVNDGIWNRPQHKKKAERMRERLRQAGYTVADKDKSLGHFLKRIQAGRITGAEVDSNAPYWSDLKTLWYGGERIRVTWRGEYPQCSSTKKSVWRMLGEYADTKEKQRALVARAREVQAELDATAANAETKAADQAKVDTLDIFAVERLERTGEPTESGVDGPEWSD